MIVIKFFITIAVFSLIGFGIYSGLLKLTEISEIPPPPPTSTIPVLLAQPRTTSTFFTIQQPEPQPTLGRIFPTNTSREQIAIETLIIPEQINGFYSFPSSDFFDASTSLSINYITQNAKNQAIQDLQKITSGKDFPESAAKDLELLLSGFDTPLPDNLYQIFLDAYPIFEDSNQTSSATTVGSKNDIIARDEKLFNLLIANKIIDKKTAQNYLEAIRLDPQKLIEIPLPPEDAPAEF